VENRKLKVPRSDAKGQDCSHSNDAYTKNKTPDLTRRVRTIGFT
jgi:hypothetical protein